MDEVKLLSCDELVESVKASLEDVFYDTLNCTFDADLLARAAIAAMSRPTTVVTGEGQGERFWLVLQEPGCVPERKGPWLKSGLATIIRECIAARPTAYIHVLTVDEAGEPHVEHGPQLLQMLDGRSMNTGRKHSERTRIAHAHCHAQPESNT